MGSLPATILGFGLFRTFALEPFSMHDNVLVQTVAVASSTMPLAAGFVGVIPALHMMNQSQDGHGPVDLSVWQMFVWTLCVSFFGVFFAVPLRERVIIKEKLRFPSGTATAEMIRIMHQGGSDDTGRRWQSRWTALWWSFGISGTAKLLSYFIPQIWKIHVMSWLGLPVLTTFQWTLTPTGSYFGQGMIMGFRTGFSTLIGAVLGWGILAPIAQQKHWADGPVDDFARGASGWIMWIALSILLADSLASVMIMIHQSLIALRRSRRGLSELHLTEEIMQEPKAFHVPRSWWICGLVISSCFCTAAVKLIFGIPVTETFCAIVFALLVSVLAVRALGETDLNPVSGIGKISQLLFGVIAPGKIVSNLLAGAIAQSSAQQAGDLMQDLKTGHILRSSSRVQMYGQLIGCLFSSFSSVLAYLLYSTAYTIGEDPFPAPTAYVWLDMARLVDHDGLPPHVMQFAVVSSVITFCLALIGFAQPQWVPILPSSIGIAVGMYVSPNFTVARFCGSLLDFMWFRIRPSSHRSFALVVASGLVLGEGVTSILNALLKIANVPTLT